MTSIELLSPARNLECGISAIDHGADAVYIGASRFGARAAACNPVDDIASLVIYAHQFGAKVYATVNTILYEDETEEARLLAWQLYHAGVDALIVQDMAFFAMDMPPIPLHASTQMDNRTVEKAELLSSMGFKQIVLARELSLEAISAIHKAVPDVRLEAFVHGALCVSYSGQCYASQHCFGRSANRGQCAQFCRLPFSLTGADGQALIRDRYLLSLRDMNRAAELEAMIDAGVRCFKIEGRLKDISYVKNVTASYRQALDAILARRTEYHRASFGTSAYNFRPNLERSFSRGSTDYFLHGRTTDLASPLTPKSRGMEVGSVKELRGGCIIVASAERFNNGDGLCYFDRDGQLQGFRVNRAEGNHLYPSSMPTGRQSLRKGDFLWRSFDQEWERLMSGKTAERRIAARFAMEEKADGFSLTFTADDGISLTQAFPAEHQLARTDQSGSIREVLSKLGDTPYVCQDVVTYFSQPWFIPRSLLSDWRRTIIASATASRQSFRQASEQKKSVCQQEDASCRPSMLTDKRTIDLAFPKHDFHLNVSNGIARRVYESIGVEVQEQAVEASPRKADDGRPLVLMTCRFCILHAWGWCKKNAKRPDAPKGPLFLVSNDGRRFPLEFDCKRCEMKVLAART